MNKAEWEEAFNEFDTAYKELYIHERNYKNGSNQKKKADADREIGFVITSIKYLFRKYPDVYELASGGEKVTEFDRIVFFDEFYKHHHIVNDLWFLLNSMKEKIKSIEN